MDRRQRNVALLVAACFFMELLDGTIVTTAAPQIGASLDVPATSISLVITAYLVTLAALIPLSGWLAGRLGARRVFLSAIAVFTAASIACALSTSLPELVAARVLQGAGGAMMVPVGRYVVLARTPKAELMKATAYLIWPGLVAPILAPLAGGVITTYASWHWIFLLNVPLGVVAFAFALRMIESPALDEKSPPLDHVGVLLSCTGIAGLTLTAQLLSESSPWGVAVALGAGSLLAMVVAIRHLLRAADPLINLRALRVATFGASIGGSAIFFLVIGAGPFIFPLLFQEAFGWSPIKSGSVVLFIFVGNIGIKPATTFIFSRFGFRAVLSAMTAVMAATMVLSAFLTAATPLVVIALLVGLSGVARSVGATGYTTMAFVDVPDHQMRDASTLQATVQQLSAGLGVAVAAIALRIGGPVGEALPGAGGPTDRYSVAFMILALISLLATVGALRLHPSAGDVLRGAKRRGSDVDPATQV